MFASGVRSDTGEISYMSQTLTSLQDVMRGNSMWMVINVVSILRKLPFDL